MGSQCLDLPQQATSGYATRRLEVQQLCTGDMTACRETHQLFVRLAVSSFSRNDFWSAQAVCNSHPRTKACDSGQVTVVLN